MSGTPVPEVAVATRFDQLVLYLASVLVAGFVFVPLVLVHVYATDDGSLGNSAAEAVVGTAVLLRVAVRRVFRTAARSLFQTTIGTFSRASARTITRRVVRLAVKSATVTLKEPLTKRESGSTDAGFVTQSPLRAVTLATVALALSFYGVLWVVGPELAAPLNRLLPPLWSAALAAVPMVVFALLVHFATRWQRVEVRFHTALDGLLLQAYFTGAGSFLPLTTDVEYFGERRATARVATCVLTGLLALHWSLFLIGQLTGWFSIEYLGVMILIYGFVYSFPLRPLDGHYLWRHSKWQWGGVWLAMLVTFIRNVPDAIQGIL